MYQNKHMLSTATRFVGAEVVEQVIYSHFAVLHFRGMMTSSNGNISALLGLCVSGEMTGHQRIPLTKASDTELWCFLWFALDKRLSKQSRRQWFETPSRSLWCTLMAIEVVFHKVLPLNHKDVGMRWNKGPNLWPLNLMYSQPILLQNNCFCSDL